MQKAAYVTILKSFALQEAQRQDQAAEMMQPSSAKGGGGAPKATNNIWDSAADIALGPPRDQDAHEQNGAACNILVIYWKP